MGNGNEWRVGMQQALRNGSISHSGTSGLWTFTVDGMQLCQSPDNALFLTVTRHRWYCIWKLKICSHLWGNLDWRYYSCLMTVAVKSFTVAQFAAQVNGDKSQSTWSLLWLLLLYCLTWSHLSSLFTPTLLWASYENCIVTRIIGPGNCHISHIIMYDTA